MPFKPEPDLFGIGYLILLVVLIGALIVVLYFKKKKWNDRKGVELGSKVQVIDKIYLDNKTKLFVIKCHDDEFFVVSNSNAVSISEKVDSAGKRKKDG